MSFVKILPYRVGASDAHVSFLATAFLYAVLPRCSLTYKRTGKDMRTIVVIEFRDLNRRKEYHCDPADNVIKLIWDNSSIDVCEKFNDLKPTSSDIEDDTRLFIFMNASKKITLNISTSSFFETMKITATAARALDSAECEDYEVGCYIHDENVCVEIELQCDKNINCGKFKGFDEDYRVCDADKFDHYWYVVLCSIIMLTIISLFVVNLIYTWVPHISDNFFIFNEDEDNRLNIIPLTRPILMTSSNLRAAISAKENDLEQRLENTASHTELGNTTSHPELETISFDGSANEGYQPSATSGLADHLYEPTSDTDEQKHIWRDSASESQTTSSSESSSEFHFEGYLGSGGRHDLRKKEDKEED